MKIIKDPDELPDEIKYLAITLGNFDGIHQGHRLLIENLAQAVQPNCGHKLLFTFEPHPAAILAPERIPPRLTTKAEQSAMIEAAGVDFLLYYPFTAELARLSAWEFIKSLLHDKLHAKNVIVGPNFRFGHQRSGDVRLLKQWGAELGFTTTVVKPAMHDGSVISSSRIRQLLLMGEVEQAAILLGYNYCLSGLVVSGAARGREMGYPTLNVALPEKLIPASGVYLTKAELNDKWYFGVSNLGVRPTFNEKALTLETYFLDYESSHVPREIKIHFLRRIRDEKKFNSIDELISQIKTDIVTARDYVKNLF